MAILDSRNVERLTGFGMTRGSDGYVVRPLNCDELRAALEEANHANRKIVLRGSGRSYGDASELAEAVVIDLTNMNKVLSFDAQTGVIDVEAGATIEDIWRTTIIKGWWPPVVSGTMFPTMGGALAMNIHGKNHFRVGSIAEQVIEIEIMLVSGERRTLYPFDALFRWICGSAGLLAIITRAKLQLKRIKSGMLNVTAHSVEDWDEQFRVFERYARKSDYIVSWVDCFSNGRGLIHTANYVDAPKETLALEAQDLPDKFFGVIPKSSMWRILKLFNNRLGMRIINAAKFWSSRLIGNKKSHHLSLVEFSFLLDYVPNWKNAYLPDGFIQYQCFVPKQHAKAVFTKVIELQQDAKMESYLGVMKRHRSDAFPLSYAVDGYSLAMDFKVRRENWNELQSLCAAMTQVVLDAGGKFYFAKDSTLRPEDVSRYLGETTLDEFSKIKGELDPNYRLSSALAERIQLFQPSLR